MKVPFQSINTLIFLEAILFSWSFPPNEANIYYTLVFRVRASRVSQWRAIDRQAVNLLRKRHFSRDAVNTTFKQMNKRIYVCWYYARSSLCEWGLHHISGLLLLLLCFVCVKSSSRYESINSTFFSSGEKLRTGYVWMCVYTRIQKHSLVRTCRTPT